MIWIIKNKKNNLEGCWWEEDITDGLKLLADSWCLGHRDFIPTRPLRYSSLVFRLFSAMQQQPLHVFIILVKYGYKDF